MPSKIVIISGSTTGTELWIEETVSRIGSDPHGQLCLADAELPPHLATLEFRNGAFLLHNRGETPLFLEGHALAPRGSARWPAGQTLQLTETLALRLETNGDPTPCPPPVISPFNPMEEPIADEESQEPGSEERQATTSAASKNIVPLLVTLGCAVLGVLLLMTDSSPQENVSLLDAPREFERLIHELGQEPPPPGLNVMEVRSALQAARIAQLRGDKQDAQNYYGFLRDLLLRRRGADGAFHSKQGENQLEENLWEFVGSQLRPRSEAEAG